MTNRTFVVDALDSLAIDPRICDQKRTSPPSYLIDLAPASSVVPVVNPIRLAIGGESVDAIA
jgi:hypothetical protein